MQVAGWIPRRALTGVDLLEGRARYLDWQGPLAFAELPREQHFKEHARHGLFAPPDTDPVTV